MSARIPSDGAMRAACQMLHPGTSTTASSDAVKLAILIEDAPAIAAELTRLRAVNAEQLQLLKRWRSRSADERGIPYEQENTDLVNDTMHCISSAHEAAKGRP